ncbi:uncharacterized protein ACBR49_013517 isoform 1-T2 [Aulostomus maculatus]
MNLHHHRPDGCCQQPGADRRQLNLRGPGCSWYSCGHQPLLDTTQPAFRNTQRGSNDNNYQHHSDVEEELEAPLPLRSEDELQGLGLPHHNIHNYDVPHPVDVWDYLSAGERLYSVSQHHRHPCHHYRGPCTDQNWLQLHDSFVNDSAAHGGVSVNVPEFSIPPVETASQVSVTAVSSEASASPPAERGRAISLPHECRNVFITYSSDASSEMVALLEFLTNHGFHAAIDISDNPNRCMDINRWEDSFLRDPSTLIIIAISPKYKADIEDSVVDNHGLHIKYIHSMMQHEFIQQGSLNYRFIPVLFLNATQKHIPGWLQNTRVYRWPQDTEDLLLQLLREEKFLPPPVPMELTLIIRPAAPSVAATP